MGAAAFSSPSLTTATGPDSTPNVTGQNCRAPIQHRPPAAAHVPHPNTTESQALHPSPHNEPPIAASLMPPASPASSSPVPTWRPVSRSTPVESPQQIPIPMQSPSPITSASQTPNNSQSLQGNRFHRLLADKEGIYRLSILYYPQESPKPPGRRWHR